MKANATMHPAPQTLATALAEVGLTVSLTVQRTDGRPLDANDLAALDAIVMCHDLEHAAPVSDEVAAKIASLAPQPSTLHNTGAAGRSAW